MEDLSQPIDSKFASLRTALLDTELSKIDYLTGADALVRLAFEDSVFDCLRVLSEKRISSAPVFDKVGKYHGVCDYMMLLRYAVRVAKGEIQTPPLPSFAESHERLKQVTLQNLVRGEKTAGKIILGEYDPPIQDSMSLYSALQVRRDAHKRTHKTLTNTKTHTRTQKHTQHTHTRTLHIHC
jgi:hypothetical protein